jgi:hypothetical protein
MRSIRLAPIVAFALIPSAAWSQGDPVGTQFRVNTFTARYQTFPEVARDTAGNFVVVWSSPQDGGGYGIFGQRFAGSGTPLGPEFRVNSYTTGLQRYPSVAAGSSGGFVVVWQSEGQDGSYGGIYGQRYANSGIPLGPEFRINAFTANRQTVPTVASNGAGDFVVVWSSYLQDGAGYGVFAQRYGSSGGPLGPEFRVNTYTTNRQAAPSAAMDPLGNFIITWNSLTQDGSSEGAFGQRYSSAGTPLGPEFRVNTFTTGFQSYPQVAADASGNFTIIWSGSGPGEGDFGIFGQRYASSGAPLGPEFRVNTYTTNDQYVPSAALDSSGNFVVVWDSITEDGSGRGVFGQRYVSSGVPLGPEFRVNTYTTGDQNGKAVAADSAGHFVVVWQSGHDGSGSGVFGQRYSMIVPSS